MFQLRERGTSVWTEVRGGLVTYLTLSYILFVQPAVLAAAGMPPGDVFFATCVASAVACFLMALLANYPIALAPAMGHNFFFAFTVCGLVPLGMGFSWQEALFANFLAGAFFVVVSLFGLREAVMTAVPDCLKYAIAVGIGLLIAFVGLQYGGLVQNSPAVLVRLGDLRSPVALVVLAGVAIAAILAAIRFRAAILAAVVATAVIALAVDATGPRYYKPDGLEVITEAQFLERAGLLDERGRLPRARQALFADAVGTVIGTVMGTSTVTSYVESAAGVREGARTGLAAIVTGMLLLASLVFAPVVEMIGMGVHFVAAGTGEPLRQVVVGTPIEVKFYPVIAPVLIIIGVMMMGTVCRIKWEEYDEAIPAFLTIVVMQFSISITDGIAWGFISYTLLKVVTGRARELHWLVGLFAVLFIAQYVARAMLIGSA